MLVHLSIQRVTGIAQSMPVDSPLLAVTVAATQCLVRGHNHVGEWKVHLGGCEIVAATVWQAGDFGTEFKRGGPVKCRPETLVAMYVGYQEITIDRVIGLFAAVYLEGPDLCIRVVVVTGPSNGGKTETAIALVEELRAKDVRVAGFVQPGEMAEDRKVGFRLRDVATGEEAVLATRGTRREGRYGTYFQFFDEGFELGRKALQRVKPGSLLVIDELGPVELRGEGHMPAVRDALAVPDLIGAVIVVRRHLVPSLLAELNASDAIVIDVEKTGDRAADAVLEALRF